MIPKCITVKVTFIAEGSSKEMVRYLDDPLDDINLFRDKMDSFLSRLDENGTTKPGTSDL